MAQAYYNGAQGWFRIWDGGHENLQQYGIDGHFVGLVLGATHHRGRLGLNWGAHVNDFTRDHFMDVVGRLARVPEQRARRTSTARS